MLKPNFQTLAAHGETLRNHCSTLEVAFAKSYVHGLFESLQTGHYVHRSDVQEAIRLCRETKIEVDLSEYIQVRRGEALMFCNSRILLSNPHSLAFLDNLWALQGNKS